MALPQPGITAPQAAALNLAHQLTERHLAEGRGARPALRWLSRRRARREISYAELSALAARAARVLADHGVGRGDVVATLLSRQPEWIIAALGAWRLGAVFCPLSASFGPDPVKSRLDISRAKLLVACGAAYGATVATARPALANLQTVLLVGAADDYEDCGDFCRLLAAVDPAAAEMAAVGTDDPAWLHFTSGATDTPKGVLHGHGVLDSLAAGGRTLFGLTPDDIFWCTADPGWVVATAYGMVTPLANGCLTLLDEGDFDARRWYATLRDEKVTVWYTTPTAIRMMMRQGTALARSFRGDSLRVAASCGEPLNPEAVTWGEKAFGTPFLDTWWQTETGGITIANLPGSERPGSMGRPMPGIEAAVLRPGTPGIQPVEAPDQPGELAIKAGLDSLCTGLLGEDGRFQTAFADGWYRSGDLVRRDADGYFWFLGRADDMIKSAAHSVGPFEVEAALLEHPAVAEVGVVGRPDPLLAEVPVAFVTVSPGFEAGESLRLELLGFARQQLGAALAPQEIHFLAALPKTPSGKILRRSLRAEAAGDPVGVVRLPRPSPARYDDE